MEKTPILSLPIMVESQAQKHVTYNEALMQLDVLLHLSVIAKNLKNPPATPAEGDRYIINAVGTGQWATHDNEIAIFRDNGWVFFSPVKGWRAYVEADNELLFYDGSAWINLQSNTPAYERLAINTSIDANAHLSVQSDTVLFSHDTEAGTGGVQAAFNKQTALDTASILFQSAWTGHAEMGLSGNNDFSVKVSPDGTSWTAAMKIDGSTANLDIPTRLLIGDGNHRGNGLTIAKPNPSIYIQDTTGVDDAHSGVISWIDGNDMEQAWLGLGSNANGQFRLLSRYEDGIRFITHGGAHPIEFAQHNTVRMLVSANGNVGIHETAPTAPLHVNGAVRVGNVTVATLPSAANSGAGAIIYVSDETDGATLAFSDGSNWLRAQDRAIVS